VRRGRISAYDSFHCEIAVDDLLMNLTQAHTKKKVYIHEKGRGATTTTTTTTTNKRTESSCLFDKSCKVVANVPRIQWRWDSTVKHQRRRGALFQSRLILASSVLGIFCGTHKSLCGGTEYSTQRIHSIVSKTQSKPHLEADLDIIGVQ
jgi:hypothetical protein